MTYQDVRACVAAILARAVPTASWKLGVETWYFVRGEGDRRTVQTWGVWIDNGIGRVEAPTGDALVALLGARFESFTWAPHGGGGEVSAVGSPDAVEEPCP